MTHLVQEQLQRKLEPAPVQYQQAVPPRIYQLLLPVLHESAEGIAATTLGTP